MGEKYMSICNWDLWAVSWRSVLPNHFCYIVHFTDCCMLVTEKRITVMLGHSSRPYYRIKFPMIVLW